MTYHHRSRRAQSPFWLFPDHAATVRPGSEPDSSKDGFQSRVTGHSNRGRGWSDAVDDAVGPELIVPEWATRWEIDRSDAQEVVGQGSVVERRPYFYQAWNKMSRNDGNEHEEQSEEPYGQQGQSPSSHGRETFSSLFTASSDLLPDGVGLQASRDNLLHSLNIGQSRSGSRNG